MKGCTAKRVNMCDCSYENNRLSFSGSLLVCVCAFASIGLMLCIQRSGWIQLESRELRTKAASTSNECERKKKSERASKRESESQRVIKKGNSERNREPLSGCSEIYLQTDLLFNGGFGIKRRKNTAARRVREYECCTLPYPAGALGIIADEKKNEREAQQIGVWHNVIPKIQRFGSVCNRIRFGENNHFMQTLSLYQFGSVGVRCAYIDCGRWQFDLTHDLNYRFFTTNASKHRGKMVISKESELKYRMKMAITHRKSHYSCFLLCLRSAFKSTGLVS